MRKFIIEEMVIGAVAGLIAMIICLMWPKAHAGAAFAVVFAMVHISAGR